MHKNTKLLALSIPAAIGITTLFSHSALAADPSIKLTNISASTSVPDLRPGVGSPASNSSKATFRLDVSNSKSYAVYVSSSNSNLVGKNDSSNTIPTMSDTDLASSIGELTPDTWGYRAAVINPGDSHDLTSQFKPIPELTILDNTKPANLVNLLSSNADYIGGDSNVTDLTIERHVVVEAGVRVSTDTNPDIYEGKLLVSAVATPLGTTIFGISNMQQMTPEICANTPTPTTDARLNSIPVTTPNYKDLRADEVYAATTLGQNGQYKTTVVPEVGLVDERDGHSYLISKLADGNCWMVQNLSLAGGTEISSANSDITNENLPASLSNMGVAGKYKLPASSMDGFKDSDTGFTYNGKYANNTYNTQGYAEYQANCDSASSTAGCNGLNSGSYYSWKVATASSAASNTKDYNAPSSICPKGWKLPTGSNNADSQFQALYDAYKNDYNAFSIVWHSGSSNAPTFFVGSFLSDKLYNSGSNADWWTSTISLDANSYGLSQSVTGFYPANSLNHYRGISVRCVAR